MGPAGMKRCAVWWDWKGRRRTWQIKIWQILFFPITITTFDYCAHVYTEAHVLYLWAADLSRGGPEEEDWWLRDKKERKKRIIFIYFKARKDDVKNVFFLQRLNSRLFFSFHSSTVRCRVCTLLLAYWLYWWWVQGVLSSDTEKIKKSSSFVVVPLLFLILMPPDLSLGFSSIFFFVPRSFDFPSRPQNLLSHALALFGKKKSLQHLASLEIYQHSYSIWELLLLFSF